MVPVIHEWRKNPLRNLRFANPRLTTEMYETMRRLFVPMTVVQFYTAPEHLYVEQDEAGQWVDDGGRNAP